MAREIYDTATLLAVMREQDSPQNYFLNLLFTQQMNSDDEYIDFEKIPRNTRKLAPFVAPMAQGRPIYESGSTVGRFKPAYIKPKDPVNPSRVLRRRPGELLSPNPANPAQRYQAIKADITAQHRNAIERRWEWMAAQAALYGAVTVDGPDYPTQVVDFQRAANHTVTKAAGAYWGQAGVSIMDDIQSWMDRMQLAKFGGVPTRMTVGVTAWGMLRKDAEFKDMMDTQFRGTDGSVFNRGLLQPGQVRNVGNLGGFLDVYVYNDFYEVNGTATPFMDPRDILLSGPAVDGYRCFGAILDQSANFAPLEIFPTNWIENDPPVEFLMAQSSPLMVPLNPNATLRARVVA